MSFTPAVLHLLTYIKKKSSSCTSTLTSVTQIADDLLICCSVMLCAQTTIIRGNRLCVSVGFILVNEKKTHSVGRCYAFCELLVGSKACVMIH